MPRARFPATAVHRARRTATRADAEDAHDPVVQPDHEREDWDPDGYKRRRVSHDVVDRASAADRRRRVVGVDR